MYLIHYHCHVLLLLCVRCVTKIHQLTSMNQLVIKETSFFHVDEQIACLLWQKIIYTSAYCRELPPVAFLWCNPRLGAAGATRSQGMP